MIKYNNFYYHRKKGKFKDTTKEERARCLHNIICPRCSYHNKDVYIKNMVSVIYAELF